MSHPPWCCTLVTDNIATTALLSEQLVNMFLALVPYMATSPPRSSFYPLPPPSPPFGNLGPRYPDPHSLGPCHLPCSPLCFSLVPLSLVSFSPRPLFLHPSYPTSPFPLTHCLFFPSRPSTLNPEPWLSLYHGASTLGPETSPVNP